MVEKTNHYPMWKNLGIDIEKHDQLLSVLPDIFKEIYIDTQKNRPNKIGFFDFVVSDIHGIRIEELQEAKKKGQKVVGTFCLYVPDEIIIALNAISVGLCGGTNFSNYAAEDVVPANLCPLIKSAVGFALGNICPYFNSLDLLIGETTCDGKKKIWEALDKYFNLHVIETTQCKDRLAAREHFKAELITFIKELEKLTGNTLTTEKFKDAMIKIEKKRNQIRRVYETRKVDPPPISGKDALLVSQIAFYDDPDRQIQMVGELADELEQRIRDGKGVVENGTKRILISGTPMAIPNWKLHHLLETSGAVVVVEETCTGTRYFESKLNISGNTVDELLENIVDRYLNINCACFTPNNARVDDIKRLVKEYNVDGVILYSLSFCQPYIIESINIEKQLKDLGIPTISIETDYSSEDIGQLSTRVQAFLEMIVK